MNTGRSNTIGVIHEGIENPVFAVAMRGVMDAAAAQGTTVLMVNTGGDVDAERRAVETLLAQHVDGLIVCPANGHDAAHLFELVTQGVPLVLWERRIPGLEVPVIEVDSIDVMREFTTHATDLGHHRIGFISTVATGPHRYSVNSDTGSSLITDRLSGIISAQQELLGHDSADLFRFATTGTADEVAEITRELFETSSPPTLLLTSDNEIALVAFLQLESMHLTVPSDVSVATFDDVAWAKLTTPKTTIVGQPTYEMATAATDALLQLRQGSAVELPVPRFSAAIRWRASVEPRSTAGSSGGGGLDASSVDDATPSL
jgi:LacI family transcriptional regulator